jgi:Zn-dependent protease
LAGINFVDVFIIFLVLLFSLTVHEAAHALTADRLGDPTARLLGRVSLNPAVHIDPIGTIVFPLIAIITSLPVLGWAKPVPVNVTRLRGHWKRKYMLIAAAGPASNLVLAVIASILLHVIPVSGRLAEAALGPLGAVLREAVYLNVLLAVFNMVPVPPLDGGNVLAGLLPYSLAVLFNRLRPYGFLLLYALILSRGFEYIVEPPYRIILAWLPTK